MSKNISDSGFRYEDLKDRAEKIETLSVEDLLKISTRINSFKKRESHELVYITILRYFMESPKSTKVSKTLLERKGTAPYSGKCFNGLSGVSFEAKKLPDELNKILFCLIVKQD